MKLEPCTGMQSRVKREKRIGLSTQPCGTPVFKVRMEESWLLILIDCGLLLRKSSPVAEGDMLEDA